VRISLEPADAKRSFWTLLPVTKEKHFGSGWNYIHSGAFVLPHVEGPVVRDVLKARNPFREFLVRLGLKDKNVLLRLTDSRSGIVVRLRNSLLNNLFRKEDENWKENVDYTFIDERLKSASSGVITNKIEKYRFDPYESIYGGSRTIKSILGKGGNIEENLMKSINKQFADIVNIHHYAF